MTIHFLYHPFYCEENIWHLAKQLNEPEGEVWFLINRQRAIAIAMQKAAQQSPVMLWDYHVIYYSPKQGIYDLDTFCGLPCEALRYLEESFLQIHRAWPALRRRYAPSFRLIPAGEFIKEFASTREHMRLEDGRFQQPPPPWDCIGSGHRLDEYLDVDNHATGMVVTLEQLLTRL